MALGRKFAVRRSLSLIPARLRQIETEKKAMPNDMTKRGWRTRPITGAKTAAVNCSHHEARKGIAAPKRLLRSPVVATRILFTRVSGGSASCNDLSQLRP